MGSNSKTLHIAMYPWFAIGHITPYIRISNKLAQRGHKISFLLPPNTISKLEHLNLHPNLFSFVPIYLPHVDGLPPGSETTNDVPLSLRCLLATAMDLTQVAIEAFLRDLKPHFIFYDLAYWVPSLARGLGIKPILFSAIGPATIAYPLRPGIEPKDQDFTEYGFNNPAPELPCSAVRLRAYEAREWANHFKMEFGIGNISFKLRGLESYSNSDAIIFKTFREMEGPYCDYVGTVFKKPVFLTGHLLPKPDQSQSQILEEKWASWLGKFKPRSVIFCAFGNECVLSKKQFQELVLGLELTGMPFLTALKPPVGAETVESALPEGFKERTEGRGVVQGGWVQQQLILNHPSVGCYLNHCGTGSLAEAMVTECQLVLLPFVGDHFVNARVMGGDLKVGIEIERDEQDGRFTREGVCKALKDAMEQDSEVGQEIRSNHAKLRNKLCREGLEESYIQDLDQKLHHMLHS